MRDRGLDQSNLTEYHLKAAGLIEEIAYRRNS